MQLEAGKRYVTRDGRMTTPLAAANMGSLYFPFTGRIEGEDYLNASEIDRWTVDGRYLLGGFGDDSEYDLVAEANSIEPGATDIIPIASRLDLVIEEVRSERAKQDAKWGEQNHEPHRWLSILIEEVGEAAQAANDSWDHRKSFTEQAYKQECYRQELVQVAAVTIAMIESLDRNGK